MRLATTAAACLIAGATLAATGFVQPAVAAGPPAPGPGSHLMMDAASAPSLATMRTWQATSPYDAIGVYIDVDKSVDDRYDKVQANLTPSWVAAVQAGGWHVLPIYVGRQAPDKCTSRSFHYISLNATKAAAQGRAAADDAASSASALGLSAGAPIVLDMEAYTAGCGTRAMRAFYDAWTRQLHAHGRMSAIYGSRNSTIADVASLGSHGFATPDSVWVATASGRAQTVSLPPLVDGTYVGYRLNQFNLGVTRTYGGVAINIDESAVDDYVWDTAAPAVSMAGLAPGVRRRTVSVAWAGSDGGGSGIERYQVRTRHAAFGHRMGAWSKATATSTTQRRITLQRGQEWCVQVRATDHAGNTSRWTHQTCTSRYLDDRPLRATKGWKHPKIRVAYGHSVSVARRRGVSLSTTEPIDARSIGVVLRGQGTVQVRLGKRAVGRVSGTGLVWLTLPRQQHGVLHLRTVSRKKTAIDAVSVLV